MPLSRRALLQSSLLGGAVLALPTPARAAKALPATNVHWLDGSPPAWDGGQSWGTPWPRGTLRTTGLLQAHAADGTILPLQSWPLAYWPDGTIKWSGHALPAMIDRAASHISIGIGRNPAPAHPVRVEQQADAVLVQVAATSWRLPRTGSAIIASAERNGRALLRNVHLLASVQNAASDEESENLSIQRYTSRIDALTVEQSGPVRAVVKVEGSHADNSRQWLPFSLRLYFTADSPAVRIVHSFIWDGDADRDFLRGLGIRAQVPMAAPLHDRHVRIATDHGLFSEAVRPLTGLRRDVGEAFRQAQIDGRATPSVDTLPDRLRQLLDNIPAWGDFRLFQGNAQGFTLTKRTRKGRAPIQSLEGDRARGLAYVGTPSGGAAIGMADFWKRHPVQLDIDGAAGDVADLTAWLHAPDAPAMDMRSYRDVLGMTDYARQNDGLDMTYEDYEPGWDQAKGIARTNELWLWALPATPDAATLDSYAAQVASPARLQVQPDRIHAAGVFGDWAPRATSGALSLAIERQNDLLIDHYRDEIDRRHWYGFWNHGDVMHSYDSDRHQWRYDIGGYAWDNSELSTDLWFWYSYLRSGRADIFRMAEAMTRHTGEVDVYHAGPWAGLGTRHGVQHWSDSSKQPRVSNAAYRRIFYYLTGDERVGDLMRALVHSDRVLQHVDIGRKVADRAPESLPPGGVGAVVKPAGLPDGVIQLSFGTSWGSLVAAWFTEWERTGDHRWRDRILAGMDSIAALPRQWWAGGANFDLASGRFVSGGDHVSVSHLNAVFGIVEIMAELLPLVDAPAYRTAWIDYCKWYNAPADQWERRFGEAPRGHNLRQAHSRLTAYAAHALQDTALAARAWNEFQDGELKPGLATIQAGDGIVEIPGLSTNGAAQWGLAAIQNLALVPPD
ncbi:Tat pathway signal sequence domain protein [Sphingobium yanoikuyae]|uniref:exo-rhamnogalacturonan lyase family protein n=1 Tax=Sphingobium yanoikuyae TaxID=13690 RepID=UPI0022DDEC56|nr:Tat pathway signal sequence domain protein [Sphingobium yanoikuyae]WBQ17820.1 Tat pathway signal sequence domain protein [Sphingobium yanoikuyae]